MMLADAHLRGLSRRYGLARGRMVSVHARMGAQIPSAVHGGAHVRPLCDFQSSLLHPMRWLPATA